MTTQSNRRRTLLMTFLGIITASVGSFVNPIYQVRYNTSRSAPLGWYAIVPESDVPIGALALARLPIAAAELADQRGYLPRTVPILKRVAAVHGQGICVLGDEITIDGVPAARALTRDSTGRPLEHWIGCRRLAADELFLLSGDRTASFDSRYFGPIRSSAVIGEAIPLWTW
jgi:conjugative transfer signal peptidase TraF